MIGIEDKRVAIKLFGLHHITGAVRGDGFSKFGVDRGRHSVIP